MFDAGSIVATMVLDRAQWTQGMQKVQESVQDAQDKFTRWNKQAQIAVTKTSEFLVGMGNEIKHIGKELSKLGTDFAFFGAALSGPLLLAFNSMKTTSPLVAEQMQRLLNVTRQFQLEIAEALVPTVAQFVNLLGHMLQAFNSIDPQLRNQIVQWTLITGIFLVVGGLIATVAGKFLSLAGILTRAGGALLGFLGPWGAVAALALVTAAAFGKLGEVLKFVMSALEATFSVLGLLVQAMATGLNGAILLLVEGLTAVLSLIEKIPGAIGEAAGKAVDGLKGYSETLQKMVADGNNNIEALAQNVIDSFQGKGAVTESIMDASNGLDEFIKKIQALMNKKIDFPEIQSAFNLIQDSWKRTADAMAQSFSNLFYDAVTGQLKSLKDYFADFGRSVLRILSDVLAKLLITQLLGSINIGGMQPFNLLGGHAEGIDEVPETGNYRLHRGEQVVPKYDKRGSGQVFEIHNFITPEAVAAAMSSKAGQNVIVNVIDRDALTRGKTRMTARGN